MFSCERCHKQNRHQHNKVAEIARGCPILENNGTVEIRERISG